MRLVINRCFGGFGLSDEAYEKLISWGVPVRKYIKEVRDEETKRYKPESLNEGEIIFDRELTPPDADSFSGIYHKFKGSRSNSRYWDTWIRDQRSHPLLLRVVEEMGQAANGFAADLAIVEVPDGVDYEISDYDGIEHVAEKHRTWT